MDTTIPARKPSNSILFAIGALFLVILIGAGVVVLLNQNAVSSSGSNPIDNSSSSSVQVTSTHTLSSSVDWQYDQTQQKWQSSAAAPNCDNPLQISFPADLNIATAILYPGQVRGGDYKAHGGARFDNAKNSDIQVLLPLDAKLIDGSRYIESGDVQYMLDFIAPCGIMIRFDHLLTLDPQFQALVDAQLPAARPDDSRTTNFTGSLDFTADTLVATAVGHPGNVSFDFGVYDLRQQNQISQDKTWASAHTSKASQSFFAVCWLNLLPAEQKSKALALPGAGTEGKRSDYCK